jgi:hypothetical protein
MAQMIIRWSRFWSNCTLSQRAMLICVEIERSKTETSQSSVSKMAINLFWVLLILELWYPVKSKIKMLRYTQDKCCWCRMEPIIRIREQQKKQKKMTFYFSNWLGASQSLTLQSMTISGFSMYQSL